MVSALSGFTSADTGAIRISDTRFEATGQNYAALIRDDIAHVQQTPRLFDHLTVAENLFIENPLIRKKFGVISHKSMLARATALLNEWNIDIRANAHCRGTGRRHTPIAGDH